MINTISLISNNEKLNYTLWGIISKIIPNSSCISLDNFPEVLSKINQKQNTLFFLLSDNENSPFLHQIIINQELKNNNFLATINIHKKSIFNIISEIISKLLIIAPPVIEHPFLEGESKKIFRISDSLALVELKPTLYSFTYNRYGIVEGTDEIRYKFWSLFSEIINDLYLNYANGVNLKNINTNILDLASEYKNCTTESFPSNYLGNVNINHKNYIIIYFKPEIPPIEVVWKKYLVGTMKHNLKDVDKFKTQTGEIIEYEGKLPQEIIRFDWRNKLPNKDEVIPDEFANFYTDVYRAKITARFVTHILKSFLAKSKYELVDLCYFISYNGDLICSEISPDGMRIKKKGDSFDKDLWRSGKEPKIIKEVWNQLYDDLVKNMM